MTKHFESPACGPTDETKKKPETPGTLCSQSSGSPENFRPAASDDTGSGARLRLPRHVRRLLSAWALRALTEPKADVILTAYSSHCVIRKPRRVITKEDGFGRTIYIIPPRALRPEYEYLKPKPVELTLEEKYERFRRLFEEGDEEIRRMDARGEKIQRGELFFSSEEYLARMDLFREEAFKRMKAQLPYPPVVREVRRFIRVGEQSAKFLEENRAEHLRRRTDADSFLAPKELDWLNRQRALLPLKAEYFNREVARRRAIFLKEGRPFFKVRPLKPYKDLQGDTFYRNVRDRFLPEEIFDHKFHPKAYETAVRVYKKI